MTFEAFFGHLWKDSKGNPLAPFPWQSALARYVQEKRKWPATIEVPTSAGKTAIMDIAVYALAKGWEVAATRVFFVVDRRIVVDDAHDRAEAMKTKIDTLAELQEVKKALEARSATGVALQVSTMRGGMPLETAWARTPTQPTVGVSTVDQVGSRLLFRGYGVSPKMAPIHAGLLATDALIILDEAHLSRPFQQTLGLIQCYRSADWCESEVGKPLQVTSMSATLGKGDDDDHFSFKESYQDGEEPSAVLKQRLEASKKAELVTVGDKSSDLWKRPAQSAKTELWGWKQREPERKQLLEEKCATLALACLKLDYQPKVIGIILNRVNSARSVFRLLQEQIEKANIDADAILLTGRSRPIDRERLIKKYWDRLKAGRTRSSKDRPIFVVATQCIEAGANLDLDALVTELASLDALRQRFGRLDRLGELKNTRAWIVSRFDYTQVAKNEDEPIYGVSLKETFKCLESLKPKLKKKKGAKQARQDASVNLGINSLNGSLKDDYSACMVEAKHAPTLMPAHLDYFAQTNPRPAPDPDPAVFLHGPDSGPADVQVVWRADLPKELKDWQELIALLPPTSAEGLPLPIYIFKQWFAQQQPDDVADLEGVSEEERNNRSENKLRSGALIWRGKQEVLTIESIKQLDRLHPGDTIVLPSDCGGLDRFGWNPESEAAVDDVADVALTRQRGRPTLRLNQRLVDSWTLSDADVETQGVNELKIALKSLRCEDDDDSRDSVPRSRLNQLLSGMRDSACIAEEITQAAKGMNIYRPTPYPDGSGWILVGPKNQKQQPVFLWEDDDASLAEEARSLESHANDVASVLSAWIPQLNLTEDLKKVLGKFPPLHDIGKADPRFQDFLYGGHMESVSQPLRAKSEDQQLTKAEFLQLWQACQMPHGWRHEFCSLDVLRDNPALIAELADEGKELLQHLIGTHHGYGRILLPVVEDKQAQSFDFSANGNQCALKPRHTWCRLDSGWIDRFAKHQHQYGWYGLAYLEAVVRLADHVASAKPNDHEPK